MMLLITLTLAAAAPQAGATQPVDQGLQACFATLYAQTPDTEPCETASLAADPATSARASSALGMIHAGRGELRLARRYIEQALQRRPDDAIVQGNHGNLLLLEQNFADALAAYDRALTLPGADHASIYLNRSLVMRALGDYAGAQADYAQYLRLRD